MLAYAILAMARASTDDIEIRRRPATEQSTNHLRRVQFRDSRKSVRTFHSDLAFRENISTAIRITPGDIIPNETTAEITGLKPNNRGDTHTLGVTIILSGVLTVFVLLLSAILRRFNAYVYIREDIGLDVMWKNSYLGLICKGYSTTAEEAIEAAGLDAWMLMEFYSLIRRIFTYLGPILMLVLCPLHFFASPMHSDLLCRFDIANLPGGSRLFWVHAVCVWLVVLVSTGLMSRAHDSFLEQRFAWMNALPLPRATTLLIENIPPQYRSDKALQEYFSELFGEDAVQRAYIVRKTDALRFKVRKLESIAYDLMWAESVSEQAGRPKYLEQELVAYRQNRADALAAVEEERRNVEEAVENMDLNVCCAAGFVTFSSQLWRRLASKEQYRTDVTEFVTQIPPDPNDVIYSDLKRDPLAHHTSEAVGVFCIAMVFLFWSPVVVFLSGFTTFNSVQEHVTIFRVLKEQLPAFALFLEGLLATAAMKLFMALLPSILNTIISNFFTRKAGAWAQLRLERWYVTFLFIFVVLVAIVGRSLIITVVALALQPSEIFGLLAASLPGASHFYIDYLVLDWFTTAWQIVRHGNLLAYWFYRVFRSMKPEVAKQYSEPENQAFFGMGARMGHGVVIATVALVLCACSPVITLLAWVSFTVGRAIYGYLQVFVEPKKPDTGGLFWIEALKQVFLALLLYVFLMIGILIKQAETGAPSIVAACSLFTLHRAWERFNNLAWDELPLEEVVAVSKKTRLTSPEPTGEYVQQECVANTSQRGLSVVGVAVMPGGDGHASLLLP